MLARTGRVAGSCGRTLEIEFPGKAPGCAGCRSGCGLLRLAGAFQRPPERLYLEVDDAADWPVGRQVRVSVPTRGFPRSLLIAYGLPLLTMLLAAVLAGYAWPGGDGAVLLACLMGLAAGTLVARMLGRGAVPEPRLAHTAHD